MKIKPIISLFFFSTYLFAFNDSDLDGVSDNIDRCPNTGSLDLVDRLGCSKKQTPVVLKKTKPQKATSENIKGGLFEIGLNSNFTSIDNTYEQYNITLGYSFNKYTIWIYDSNYKNDEKVYSDLTLSFGYNKYFNNLTLSYNFGTTFYINNSKDNNYFFQLSGNYNINNQNYLFFYTTYTINSKETEYHNKNYISLNLGYGKYISNKLLLNLSINYESKVADEFSNSLWIDIGSSYNISDNYYFSSKYSRYLKGDEEKNALYLGIGVKFWIEYYS